MFNSIKFYEFSVALIIAWLTIELRSLLRCIFFSFRISFQSAFIQLIIQLDSYIYKFVKNLNPIFWVYIILMMYNLILNFFLKSSSVYILKNLIILFNIINIIYKFYSIFNNRSDLVDWLDLLFYYFIIINNIEYTSSFQFKDFSVQKEASNSIISVFWEKDFGLRSYLLVCLVLEVSDGENDFSVRE